MLKWIKTLNFYHCIVARISSALLKSKWNVRRSVFSFYTADLMGKCNSRGVYSLKRHEIISFLFNWASQMWVVLYGVDMKHQAVFLRPATRRSLLADSFVVICLICVIHAWRAREEAWLFSMRRISTKPFISSINHEENEPHFYFVHAAGVPLIQGA